MLVMDISSRLFEAGATLSFAKWELTPDKPQRTDTTALQPVG